MFHGGNRVLRHLTMSMPIEMIFSSEVGDEAATERTLSVQTSVPHRGSWHGWTTLRLVAWLKVVLST
jgi:hypothetical protein